jgi:hypothetical protein
MQYMLLIYGDENAWEGMSPEEQAQGLKPWTDYTKWLKESGTYLAGDALAPTTAATTVRIREGQTLTTDGPFAETKEQLLGFYIVDCKNLDDALDVAKDLGKANPGGTYEIRPVGLLNPGSITT